MKNNKILKFTFGALLSVGLLATGCDKNNVVSLDFVKLGTTSVTLFDGESIFIPSSYTGSELTWKTSDNKVATVIDGIVKAKGSGVSVITASSKQASSTCIVNVVSMSNSNSTIRLSRNNATISVGDALQLGYKCDKDIAWATSDIDVATVNNGLIKAESVGESIITATVGDYTVECIVSVVDSMANSLSDDFVSLSRKSSVMSINDKLRLSYKASNNVTWGTNNANVATVNESGVITALSSGDAVITASCDGVTDSCFITVMESVDKTLTNYVNLSRNELTLPQNTFMQLSYIASSIDVSWKTSDSKIATINNNGEITAVGSGKAVISASCDGVTDRCVVNVVKTQEVDTPTVRDDLVILSKDTLSLNANTKFALSASATGTVTWVSSDEHIVTVDQNGIVSGIRPGTAVISARCGKAVATCGVTVTDDVSSVNKNDFIDALKYSRPTRVITNTEFTYKINNDSITLTYSSILTIDYSGMIKTTYSYSYQVINDPMSGNEEMISTYSGVIYTEGTTVGEATENGIVWNTTLEGSVTLFKFDYETLKTYGIITESKQIYLTVDASSFAGGEKILKGDNISKDMLMTIFIQSNNDEYNIKGIDYEYEMVDDTLKDGKSSSVETNVRYYYD